jgi:hypothetical protein
MICIKFLISVSGGHCEYSPLATKRLPVPLLPTTRLVNLRHASLFAKLHSNNSLFENFSSVLVLSNRRSSVCPLLKTHFQHPNPFHYHNVGEFIPSVFHTVAALRSVERTIVSNKCSRYEMRWPVLLY